MPFPGKSTLPSHPILAILVGCRATVLGSALSGASRFMLHWICITVWLVPTLPSLLFYKCGSLINIKHPKLHLSIPF